MIELKAVTYKEEIEEAKYQRVRDGMYVRPQGSGPRRREIVRNSGVLLRDEKDKQEEKESSYSYDRAIRSLRAKAELYDGFKTGQQYTADLDPDRVDYTGEGALYNVNFEAINGSDDTHSPSRAAADCDVWIDDEECLPRYELPARQGRNELVEARQEQLRHRFLRDGEGRQDQT